MLIFYHKERLGKQFTGQGPGYPVHHWSVRAARELAVFEKSVLCYGVDSLKIAGNI
jgi:hypothetical protein